MLVTVDRRRVTLTFVAIALWVVALVWVVWRVGLFSPRFIDIGMQLPYATEALLAFADWVQRLMGLVVIALALAGAAAGSLCLGRSQLVGLAVGCSVVLLILAVVGVELVCWFPEPWTGGDFNALVQHVWGPGLALLSVLALAGAALVFAWVVAAIRTLSDPSASTPAEIGRSLFVAAPFVIALHVLGGSWLAKLQLDSFGVPLLHRDAAALTATGAVLLTAALARLALRGRVDVEPRDAEDLARAQP